MATRLLVGTCKGAYFLTSNRTRKKWKASAVALPGHAVHHVVLDPRDGRTMLLAARRGRSETVLFRSRDHGQSFTAARRQPLFEKAGASKLALQVDHVSCLSPGHASEPGVWYLGSSPQGLFRSPDGGLSWDGVAGFNRHPHHFDWVGGNHGGTTSPDPMLHSIQIDPRDANHLYIAMSPGGVFESKDRGTSWEPMNRGCPAKFADGPGGEHGHAPHCLRLHPRLPDRLYQQSHSGVYRMDRGDGRWRDIGRTIPARAGAFGFPILLHPEDPDRAWVFPLDRSRMSPGGRPAVYATRDGGGSWKRRDKGLPQTHAWHTVLRHAMAHDSESRLGLYFATTSGEIWGSRNEGRSWKCLAAHLPRICSIETTGVS